jgi:hypothetical protein
MKTTCHNPNQRPYYRAHAVEKAQTMVEFALILPLLLFIIFGLIEFGRLLAIYSMVTNSSRDAARYGAAAGDAGGGVPHYLDCVGIREAARKSAILSPISDSAITISYDTGPGTPKISTTCPSTVPIVLGSRIIVNVATNYEPIVPLGNLLKPFTINSSTVRTILTNVEIEGTPAAASGLPQVLFSTSAATVAENVGNYTLQVKLSAAVSGETYVPFSVSGTAAYCDDFSVAANSLKNVCAGPVTGEFHIPAGQTSANVVIAISDDSLDEYNETVVLTLSKPTNATVGAPSVFTLTIEDNDGEPNVSFNSTGQSGAENIGNFAVVVQLSAKSGKDVVVPFHVTDSENDALNNVDYTLPGGSVTIPAGSLSTSIIVAIIDDAVDENDEGFIIRMDTPTYANQMMPDAHTITILDNDNPPTVYFDIAEQAVGESIGTAKVTVKLSGPSSRDITVPYTIGGTATNGMDYSLYPENGITIPAGSTSADILVMVVLDDIAAAGGYGGSGNSGFQDQANAKKATSTPVILPTSTPMPPTPTPNPNPTPIPGGEGNETIIFTLGTPWNATLGSPSVHTLTILAVGGKPFASFQSAASGPYVEGTTASFKVRVVLSNAWNQDVTVPFSVNASSTTTSGQDYTIVTASPLSIPAGQIYADITINVSDDTLDEDELETLILTLGTPTNAYLGTTIQHTAQLQDNDLMPTISIAINPSYTSSGPESRTTVLVDVTMNGSSAKVVSIPFTVSSTNGATLGSDYSFSPASPLTLASGVIKMQITLTVIDDTVYGEPNENVLFTLGQPTNAQLAGSGTSVSYTIEENDLCPSIGTILPQPVGSKLDLTISNQSYINMTITSISLFWADDANQALNDVYLGTDRIWPDNPQQTNPIASPPGFISSNWKNNGNRTVSPGLPQTLSFVFAADPLRTSSLDYVSVTFNDGTCVITARRTQ